MKAVESQPASPSRSTWRGKRVPPTHGHLTHTVQKHTARAVTETTDDSGARWPLPAGRDVWATVMLAPLGLSDFSKLW